MNFQTGQTINDVFISVKLNNNPIVPTAFDYEILPLAI